MTDKTKGGSSGKILRHRECRLRTRAGGGESVSEFRARARIDNFQIENLEMQNSHSAKYRPDPLLSPPLALFPLFFTPLVRAHFSAFFVPFHLTAQPHLSICPVCRFSFGSIAPAQRVHTKTITRVRTSTARDKSVS